MHKNGPLYAPLNCILPVPTTLGTSKILLWTAMFFGFVHRGCNWQCLVATTAYLPATTTNARLQSSNRNISVYGKGSCLKLTEYDNKLRSSMVLLSRIIADIQGNEKITSKAHCMHTKVPTYCSTLSSRGCCSILAPFQVLADSPCLYLLGDLSIVPSSCTRSWVAASICH